MESYNGAPASGSEQLGASRKGGPHAASLPKKSKKRPNRSNAKQVNKAKQVQLLQKQQQQESSAAGAAAKAGRSKHAKPKPPQAVASSAINGGGNVSGGHAPTGAGPPAHPWDPKRDLPTRGLLNLGNTCFFNSALQNVFKARLLHESLFADGPGRREGEYIGPLTKAFRKVLLEMTGEGPVGGRRGAYSPKALLSAVQRAHPSFRGFHQQDAHELFMCLVGTLEDEEDLCIKRRRQEEKEAQNTKQGVSGSEGGEASRGDTDVDCTPVSTPALQPPEMDRKPLTDSRSGIADIVAPSMAEDRADGALVGNDGVIAASGAEKEGSDFVVSDNVTGRAPAPDDLPLQKANSVLARANGDKEETSDSNDGVVATSPDASTGLLCDRGESGEVCARNGAGRDQTAEGKSSGDAGAESTEAAGTAARDEDEVLVKAGHELRIGCPPLNEKESDSQQCGGGGGGAIADAETSTDDGETTDAGDHDDEGDDEADGAPISSPSRSLPGSSADPAGTDVAAVGTTKEEEKDERKDIVAAVAPAFPQRAAVTDVFGGTMCSVVTCSSCGGRSFCTEPTICLSLEIPMKPKALSKTALAFIAKKKAAAAVKAAAASVETAESDTTTVDSTCAAERQPSSASSNDQEDNSVSDPAPGEEKADEAEGFQLSAKEKKKVARQERDKQRLMQAKARADEGCSGDAAGLPGPEGDGSRPVTAKTSTEGSSRVAAQAPPDGDEVRQCLEYLVSVCIADGDADGDGGGMAGLGSEAVAVEKEADASEIGTGETAGNAAEALLPGFELSAKERKKIARQEKAERARSMGQEASTDGGGTDVAQRSPDEGHEPIGEGGECAGASDPEEGTARSTTDAETAAQQSAEKPSAGGESEKQGAAVDESAECGGSALDVSTAVSTDSSSPVAEMCLALSNGGSGERSQAQRSTNRAAGVCERSDCDGRNCGGGPPTPEDNLAGCEVSDRVRQAETMEAVAQVANDGPQDRIEVKGKDPDGVRTPSSSGSSSGCTTGEAQGGTDPGGDLGSAFGSECSEGNRNEEQLEDSSSSTDSVLKCLGSSDEPATEENNRPGGYAPVVDSPPMGDEESTMAAESKVDSSERGQGSPLPNSSVLAADENGHAMQTAGRSASDRHADESVGKPAGGNTPDGHADELVGEPVVARQEEATAGAPSTTLPSPLNRLEEPPAREKPDKHDADGIDLYGCLDHFMAEEMLVAKDGNGYDCEGCSSRARPSEDEEGDGGGVNAKPAAPRRQQNAKKRLLMLGQPPGMLVCHLKRLQAKRKIIRSVEFPIELDMAPYFWRDPEAPLTPKQTCYRLTGLIQHRGSRLGGHYVAYVRDKDGWKHASDSAIRTATLPELKACEAYMLFYEQMGSANAEGDESGVSTIASGSPDDDAVTNETNGDLDAAESGGAALSTGNKTTEAVEGKQEQNQEDGEDESASPEGQGEGEGDGVTSGPAEAHEEKGESDTAAEEGGTEGPPNGEIWI